MNDSPVFTRYNKLLNTFQAINDFYSFSELSKLNDFSINRKAEQLVNSIKNIKQKYQIKELRREHISSTILGRASMGTFSSVPNTPKHYSIKPISIPKEETISTAPLSKQKLLKI